MLLVVWHACVLGHQEDNEAHEKKREPRIRAEGVQEEARRRAGEDQEGVRKRAPTIQILKFFSVVSHFLF